MLSLCRNLRGKGLEGTIPRNGWVLPPLIEVLDLNDNSFINGSLPDNWKLPDGLKRLLLGANKLISGTISPAWQLPKGLKELALDRNQLQGSIPSNWMLPATLTDFWMWDNAVTGATGRAAASVCWFWAVIMHAWNCGQVWWLLLVAGNLPEWPDLSNLKVYVTMGNPALCGAVRCSRKSTARCFLQSCRCSAGYCKTPLCHLLAGP